MRQRGSVWAGTRERCCAVRSRLCTVGQRVIDDLHGVEKCIESQLCSGVWHTIISFKSAFICSHGVRCFHEYSLVFQWTPVPFVHHPGSPVLFMLLIFFRPCILQCVDAGGLRYIDEHLQIRVAKWLVGWIVNVGRPNLRFMQIKSIAR